jgi:hypothetical protein
VSDFTQDPTYSTFATAAPLRGRRLESTALSIPELPKYLREIYVDLRSAEEYFEKLGFIKYSFVRCADRSSVEELITRQLGGTLHPDLGGTPLTASLSEDRTRVAIINLDRPARGTAIIRHSARGYRYRKYRYYQQHLRTGRGISLALLSRVRARLV